MKAFFLFCKVESGFVEAHNLYCLDDDTFLFAFLMGRLGSHNSLSLKTSNKWPFRGILQFLAFCLLFSLINKIFLIACKVIFSFVARNNSCLEMSKI